MNRDALLDEIDARQQIHDVMVRYCRGVDRCDRAMILSAYHPDAWDDHGVFAGTPEQFADWVIDIHLNQFVWTAHYISNIYIEIDGDKAQAESYVQGLLRFKREGKLFDLSGNGRYLDRFEKRDEIWKFTYRTATADWNRIDPIDEMPAGELVKKLLRGTRDESDPSYRFLHSRVRAR